MPSAIGRFLLVILILWILPQCHVDESETNRSRVIRLLTNNSEKAWKINRWSINGNFSTLSPCDSAYILYLNANFTWEEQYSTFNCNNWSSGIWELNESSNVIQSQYLNPITQDSIIIEYEISLLNDTVFSYTAEENRGFKEVKMISK